MIIHFSCPTILSLPLQDVIFQWLTTDDIQLNNIDAEDPEVLYFYINLDNIFLLSWFLNLVSLIMIFLSRGASCFSGLLYLMVDQNV